MANTTFYERGNAYHDSAGNPAIIKNGNELTFTDNFNAGGGGGTPYTPPAYSTEEHLTGRKWIDGKDIYRKVVDVGALPNDTTKQVAHSITYDAIVSLTGICSNSDNAFLPMPAVATSSAYAIELSIDITNVVITTAQDRSAFSGYVILEYTKPDTVETNNRTIKKTSKKG